MTLKIVDNKFDAFYFDGTLFDLMYHSTIDDEWHCYDSSFEYCQIRRKLKKLKGRTDIDKAEIAGFWNGYFQCVIEGWEKQK